MLCKKIAFKNFLKTWTWKGSIRLKKKTFFGVEWCFGPKRSWQKFSPLYYAQYGHEEFFNQKKVKKRQITIFLEIPLYCFCIGQYHSAASLWSWLPIAIEHNHIFNLLIEKQRMPRTTRPISGTNLLLQKQCLQKKHSIFANLFIFSGVG